MAHGHCFAIDVIMFFVSSLVRAYMCNDLVAEEIEVNPFTARTSFGAAEQFTVEGARFVQIAHGERKMKSWTF